ncbi:MAG: type IV secretion system protein [Aestuariivirga sp.]
MTNVVDELFRRIDQLGQRFTETTYVALANEIGSIFTLLTALYVILWGYQIWAGRASGGPAEHAWRLLRVFIIYALAVFWGEFQTFVYKAATEMPRAIGNIVIRGVGGGLSSENAAIEQALSNVWHVGVDAASKITKAAGLLSPGPYIIAGIVLVVIALFVAFAAGLVILAKIVLWALLSLAPIFIVLLLFNVTTRFFNGWVSAVVQFILVPVIVYTILAFYLAVIRTAVEALSNANAGATTSLTEVAPVILAGLIGCYLLSQIVTIAQGIAGGLLFSQPRFGRFVTSSRDAVAGRIIPTRAQTLAGYRRLGIGPYRDAGPLSDSGRALQDRLARRG